MLKKILNTDLNILNALLKKGVRPKKLTIIVSEPLMGMME